MKLFKRISYILLFIILAYIIGRLSVVTYDSYVHLPRQPYLQMQTLNSIMIKWQSPKHEIGCVQYGKKEPLKKVCEEEATNKHQLRLEGLEEATRYRYSVESDSLKIDNENRFFTTLDKNITKTQYIWLIGDSGKKGKPQAQVLQSMQTYMKDKALDLWLLLGDNAYKSGSQKQYNKTLFGPYKELLKTLVPWAVIGNHDARRWAFYNIFDLPDLAQTGGIASQTEQYFALEKGDLHILMLDTETTNLDKDGALAQWLEKDLKANTKKWTIAIFHHPPYSDASHKSDNPRDSHPKLSMKGRLFAVRENILPILEKYDVDLVYSGHSHAYERSWLMHKHYQDSSYFKRSEHIVQDSNNSYCKPLRKTPYAGTIYTVAGSSAKLDQARLQHPAMPFSFENLGSVILEVKEDTLTSNFIGINAEVIDSFSLHKKRDCSL